MGLPVVRRAQARQSQAGVTLVEVLVVLVLIGVMAGVVGLSLGPTDRGNAAGREAQLLTTRLNRAADEAVLTGDPMAMVWTETAYKFLSLQGGVWVAHPVVILGTAHELEDGIQFSDDLATGGQFVVLASLHPVNGATLELGLGDQGSGVIFDGATARIMSPNGS